MITIHLPRDLETEIEAAVRRGRFTSVDEAMAEAARLLLRELDQGEPLTSAPPTRPAAPDPILGLMRDDADLMDEITADAYRRRQDTQWRELDL